MAQQARAIRTKRTILEAAAEVFDEFGYEGASTTEIIARGGFTRGALYFHFPSKEALADAVMSAQSEWLVPPVRKLKLQTVIDLTLHFAERLRTDVVLRAAVRLSVEQASNKNPNRAPYQEPMNLIEELLKEARDTGELLPGVEPEEVARVLVGAFTGIQIMSQVYDRRQGLPGRISVLWKYLLPSLAVPDLVPHLSADPERGVGDAPDAPLLEGAVGTAYGRAPTRA
ncbi:ScbR family autoregulator-binding transcription factor [Streptantibioticus ferralitis]|uniref:ScbR family autoregulator-binding transcription factor n=1 Tax=Streptantibioticus ferralitis TaxID=236510 RepID=A0ABT5YW01_9ACTN|nr:ScbR family autoregulator-binding transcription factor [Streptantibioticus ferralitis]MDF2255663.1 ScbR family autoregulator-binding transcription factor [Streptantibioticus ferralitis]